MSPEQARGQVVNKQTDIWAFGVILWEMLTGRRFSTATTASDVMAGVLRAEINDSALPKTLRCRCAASCGAVSSGI